MMSYIGKIPHSKVIDLRQDVPLEEDQILSKTADCKK